MLDRIICSFFILFIPISFVYAQTPMVTEVVQQRTIVSPPPAPRETVVTPSGYYTCATVDAGWYNNVWYPAHRVCGYQNTPGTATQGVVWVESYWACTTATADGTCTNWEWKPGHWEKTFSFY